MLIAVGTPRILTERKLQSNITNSNAINPTLITFAHHIKTALFATLSANTLFLWSCKPQILLAKVSRAEQSIKQEGLNTTILWNQYGDQIVVLTNRGFVHFYQVIEQDAPMLDFVFSSPHHYAKGPGEAKGTPQFYLRFNISLEFDSIINCGVSLKSELLLFVNEPPSLLSIGWDGEVNVKLTSFLKLLDFYIDPTDGISQIVESNESGKVALVTSKGWVYLCHRKIQMLNPFDNDPKITWTGCCIHRATDDQTIASTVAFNSCFSLMAVGTNTGITFIYEVSLKDLTAKLSHQLFISQQSSKRIPLKLSPVTSLSWSADGYTLAVSWIYGGFAVWSVYGSLLTSTICEDTFMDAPDGILTDTEEAFFTGVQSLFWAPGTHDLFLLPASTYQNEIVLDIYVIGFAKSSISSSQCNQSSKNISLIGSDKILIYDGMQADDSVVGMDPLNWSAIHIPNMYLTVNWPIRHICTSTNGQFIAVAGKHGFAHYNCANGKWKLFGNEHQENGFRVTGMHWYKSYIILSCENLYNDSYEIRVYSRESKLDDSMILFSKTLLTEILSINVSDDFLLILVKAGTIQSHEIICMEDDKIQLILRQEFSLESFPEFNQKCIQGVCRYPLMNVAYENRPIIILENGRLNLIWEDNGKWKASILATRVEHFWISSQDNKENSLTSAIWAFDGNGVQILVEPLAMANTSSTSTHKPIFNMILDFYPFMVMLDQGVLVGIKQQLTMNKALSISQFNTDLKTHLFVHLIISDFLHHKNVQGALAFGKYYQHLNYFNHALEMMLHNALEEDSSIEADNALVSVVEFINQFPKSLEIIVNCARKSEMALWPRFFSLVGDPKILYQKSLDCGLLGVATSYLIIIQTLEPLSVSSQLAIQLLDKSLQSNDFETGSELYRFLRSIFDAETPTGKTQPQSPRESLTAQERSNMLFFETLIQNKARSLVLVGRFREFLKFSSMFSIAISHWLKQERRSTKLLIVNWLETLTKLHDQFSWPYPTELPIVNNPRIDTSYPSIDARRRHSQMSVTPSKSSKKEVSRREAELRLFLAACNEGEFPEMGLLLATMLLDVDCCISVLNLYPDLFQLWEAALLSSKHKVYHDYVNLIKNSSANKQANP
ncbi:RIC1-domain-containing protein [Globomyces pollinis-pini]|nr:RIC1-domain-containing protein [Globomyces pollinis-pini]